MTGQEPTERLPDFLIIGAQKAGTTWLHRQLRGHPELYLPADKDFEYFSYPGAVSEARYAARFADAPETARIGDACASYFWTEEFGPDDSGFNRELPATVRRSLGPETRLIVLLRDPVERALSAYLHHVSFGSLSAETSILEAPGELGLIAMSRYGVHLDNWLARFDSDRIQVLPAPGEAEPRPLVDRACRFLDVGPPEPAERSDQPVFPGLKRRLSQDGGIEVRTGQPGVPEAEGIEWVQLVSAREIVTLTGLLAPDTARLAALLDSIGQRDPAFERWSTWPPA